MVVTRLSSMGISVEASTSSSSNVEEETSISEMDALKAIGIDTSQIPEGVDLESTDNPYGRDSVTVSPVYEFFVQSTGEGQSCFIGHNKPLDGNFYSVTEAYGHIANEFKIGGYEAIASAAGNFVQSESGQRAQVVTVGTKGLSEKGGLYFYFTDPAKGVISDDKELLSKTQIIGNSGNKMEEDFAQDKYLLQNYLKISAGDYDGDGVDEIAVYVAEQGASRVEIYDLQMGNDFPANKETYFMSMDKWKLAWTYSFNESPYVSNMVSITSGDINKDGLDDVGLTWGFYYGPDKYTHSKAIVLLGHNETMLQHEKAIDLAYQNSEIIRGAFAYGDIDGDNVQDLILGGQLNSDIAAGNLNSRFVAIYNYQEENDSYIQVNAKNFNLFEKKDENYVHTAMEREEECFYSLPSMVANITAYNMLGPGRPSCVYLDSLIVEYGDEGLVIREALDNNASFNNEVNEEYEYWIRGFDGRFYQEHNALAGDFSGRLSDTLHVMLDYSREYYDREVTYSYPVYRNWFCSVFGIKDWVTNTTTEKEEKPALTYRVGLVGEWVKKADEEYGLNMKHYCLQVPFATSLTRVNTDNDTSYVRYANEHGVMYSDPKVLAVLASAPHFEDLARDDFSGSYMESSTSYSKTQGTGASISEGYTIRAGAYMSYQQEIEVPTSPFTPPVKVAGMEMETAYEAGLTFEYMNSRTLEMTVGYETIVGQDSVVFYSIPIEYYIYDSYVPVIDHEGKIEKYDHQKVSMNFPRTAAVVVLPLDKYENIAADYEELPPIRGKVLTHTIGDPTTYPKNLAGYTNAIEFKGDWAGLDYSDTGAAITQEINITRESAEECRIVESIDFKIGAGPGDYIFGRSLGYENERGFAVISSVGSTYTGTIYNMPMEAEDYQYDYKWKLFTYTENIKGNKFPVVNYMVTDVKAPPKLPKDFEQSSEWTTDSSNGLTWSYPSDSSVAGFQIYRYYEFPEGSGSYELAFIPASQVQYVTKGEDDRMMRHYRYIDEGLADYMSFDYQIQAVRGNVPPKSIISGVLSARTKADMGYPDIKLNGVEQETHVTYDDQGNEIGSVDEYSVLVYPDSNTEVFVEVSGNYNEAPKYQWQKWTDEGWRNIPGAESYAYTFADNGVSDEGDYRCRVNVIYEDEGTGNLYYITSHSDTFKLNYAMRKARLDDSGLYVDLTDNTVNMTLVSSHTNHILTPQGNVTYRIRGTDCDKSVTVGLVGGKATLELDGIDMNNDGVKVNLEEGVYEITVYYGGNRVFTSYEPKSRVYYVSGTAEGHLLNIDEQYIYGDEIFVELLNVKKLGNEIVTSKITQNVTYEEVKLIRGVEQPNPIVHNSVVQPCGTGDFVIKAYVDSLFVTKKAVYIAPKQIHVRLKHAITNVSGNSQVTHPDNSMLEVVETNGFVPGTGDDFDSLGIGVDAFNSAGEGVIISPTSDPGKYKIVGAPIENQTKEQLTRYKNYSITYLPNTYILTGPRYDLTMISERYGQEQHIVGTVRLVKPEIIEDGGQVVDATTTTTNNQWYYDDAFQGGTEIIIVPTAQKGYQVKDISVTTGGETVVSGDKSKLVFDMSANDTIVTVTYELAKNELTFKPMHDGTGVIQATNASIVSGAMAQEDAVYTFDAVPEEGYHFVECVINGSQYKISEENLDPETGVYSFTFTMGSTVTKIRVLFVRDSYTLALQENLQAQYLADDGFGNMEPVIGDGTISIIGDTEVTVSPKPGYSLEDDAIWMVNGEAIAVSNNQYTFHMTQDTTVQVGTNQNAYDVSIEVEQPNTTTHNQVQVRVNNVPTDLSTTQAILGNSKMEFIAVPAWGYVFDKWVVNGEEVPSHPVNGLLVIEELDGAKAVEAHFVPNPNKYTISLEHNEGGGLDYTVVYTKSGYSDNAPNHVEVSGMSANFIAYEGDKIILEAQPHQNKMLRNWMVNGDLEESPSNTLTIEDLDEDQAIKARFIGMSVTPVYYRVDTETLGTISATYNGIPFTSGEYVENGAEVVFTVVPNSGKMVDYWTKDDDMVKRDTGIPVNTEQLVIEQLAAGTKVAIVAHLTDLVEHTLTYETSHVSIERVMIPASYVDKTPNTSTMDYVLDGSKVVLKAIPEEGYRITECIVPGLQVSENEDGSWSCIINEVTADMTISATARKLYEINIASPIENGSLTILTEKELNRALEGEVIVLSDVTPDLDYRFINWSYNGSIIDSDCFLMPAEDIIIDAAFNPTDTSVINYQVVDTNGDDEGGLNGHIKAHVMRKDGNDTMLPGYPLEDESGSITVNRGYQGQYALWPNSDVTLEATPDTGYRVKAWLLDDAEIPEGHILYNRVGNDLCFSVGEDSKDTYNFLVQYDLIGDRLTYSVPNGHGQIVKATHTSAFGEETSINSGDIITVDGTVELEVTIHEGYELEGWYINGVKDNGANGSLYSYSALAGQGVDITANIQRLFYPVSYSATQGIIKAYVDGIALDTNPAMVKGDKTVSLEAESVPKSGYTFDYWEVNGSQVEGDGNSLEITVLGATDVIAHFVEYADIPVTFSVDGQGGQLIAEKDGNAFTSGQVAAANDVLTFKAIPETVADGGTHNYRVAAWCVNGMMTPTSNGLLTQSITETTEVKVYFERSDVVVNYQTMGMGTISTESDPDDDGAVRVTMGGSLNFIAKPQEGYQVKAWRVHRVGSPEVEILTEDTHYPLTDLNEDTVIKVAFEAIPEYTITVTTSGLGKGTVDGKVNEGNLQTDTYTYTVKNHDNATLMAIRHDASHVFDGWTVTGSEYATINKNGTTLELTDITGNITVDAKFVPAKMLNLSAKETDDHGSLDLENVKAGYLSLDMMETVNLSASGVLVTIGKDVVIEANPDSGYMVENWLVNGQINHELSHKLTLNSLQQDTHIEVSFEPVVVYKIPENGDPNQDEFYQVIPIGKIPDDIGDERHVRDRGTVTFKVAPQAGYYLKSLVINGLDCLTQSQTPATTIENGVLSVKNEDGGYTITVSNVTKDIEATILAVMPMITLGNPNNGSIQVAYVNNGINTPVSSGSQLPVGTMITLRAIPDSGYTFGGWTNGASGLSGTTATMAVPSKDIILSASFRVVSSGGDTGGGGAGGYVPPTEEAKEKTIPLVDKVTVTLEGKQVVVRGTMRGEVSKATGASTVALNEASIKKLIKALEDSPYYHKGKLVEGTSLLFALDVDQTGKKKDISFILDKEAMTLFPKNAVLSMGADMGSLQMDQAIMEEIMKQVASGAAILRVNGEINKKKGKTAVEVTLKNSAYKNIILGNGTLEIGLPYVMKDKEVPQAIVPQMFSKDGKGVDVFGGYKEDVELIEITTNKLGTFIYDYRMQLFQDIATTDWFSKSITYLAARDIVRGNMGNYNPMDKVTRAEFLVMIMRAYNIEPSEDATVNFDDAGDTYYTPYLAAAKKMKITDGVGHNLFAPEKEITRQEMVKLLYGVLTTLHQLPVRNKELHIKDFQDSKDVAHWALEAMEWMIASGIINGSKGAINPMGDATRAEAAEIIYNLMR